MKDLSSYGHCHSHREGPNDGQPELHHHCRPGGGLHLQAKAPGRRGPGHHGAVRGYDRIGYPTPALTATGLPPGVTLQDNGDGTGDFVGTPVLDQWDLYSHIYATNVAGAVQKTFTLIDYQAPTLVGLPTSPITFTHGVTLTSPVTFTATGFPAPKVKITGLPKGLGDSNQRRDGDHHGNPGCQRRGQVRPR